MRRFREIGCVVGRLMLVLMAGCSSTTLNVEPLISESRWVEDRDLPVDCEQMVVDYPGSEDDVRPYEPSEGSGDRPGIIVSEARAQRDALCRAAYREMRANYKSDRVVWTTHRAVYEDQRRKDQQAIEELQPGFWDNYGNHVVGVLGFALGVISSVAMVNALDSATE